MRRGSRAATLAAAALLALAGTACASVGDFAMAVQPNGKIVAVGATNLVLPEKQNPGHQFAAVVRFLPDGSLDPGFGEGGMVVLLGLRPLTAVTVQADGRILIGAERGAIARLLPDGSLDPSFGTGGKVEVELNRPVFPTDIEVDANGLIAVGGTSGFPTETEEGRAGRVYLYSQNGVLQPWSAAMTPATGEGPTRSYLNAMSLVPGGVIAAGSAGPQPPAPADEHLALAQLVPGASGYPEVVDGPEPGFGGGLIASSFFPASPYPEAANAIAWQRGKVLVAGTGRGDLLLARYRGNGRLDSAFGHRGRAVADAGHQVFDVANAVLVQRGIVVAGSSEYGCGSAGCSSLVLARFTAGGKLDRSFGAGGVVTHPVKLGVWGRPAVEVAYGLARQPGGKILVGGSVAGPRKFAFFLKRFLPDGTPDREFGRDGTVTVRPHR
jgi:uncharacterized delta-60 repeat protein